MMLPMATRRIRFIVRMLVSVTLVAGGMSRAAEREMLDDLSARVQFDYYANDVRALQRDLQTLKQLEVPDEHAIVRQYYLAYGHMRLAEASGDQDRPAARKAASHCAKLADDIVDTEPKRTTPRERVRLDILYAELWAIQGACGSLEATLSLLPETTFSSARAREKAATLAPNNPRVQLLAAIYESKRANNAQDFTKANWRLLAVTQAFDNAPPADPDLPDWGQADAWAWLGYSYLKLGDKVAARNALERALVLTPDYVWARTLQSQLRSVR